MKSFARLVFVSVPMHLLALVMLLGVALNFANVVARYVFDAPLFWAEEALVYSMIWAVFLALPAVTFNEDHLRMDLVYASLSRPWQRIVDTVCAVLCIVCCSFAAWHSVKVVSLLMTNGQTSVAAGLPMALVHAATPVGFMLAVTALIARLWVGHPEQAARASPRDRP